MSNWYDSISGNANAFAIGNLNQFQVSPFAPATATDVTGLTAQISTCCAELSSIVNFTNYTLSISTIVPVVIDPSQTITMQGSTININANQINLNGGMGIQFTNLVGTSLSSTTAQISSLNVSTITSDVTIAGCANFRGCVSTISTSMTLGTDAWGKYLFVNKNEAPQILTINTLPSSGTFVTIKNVASSIGSTVTVNVSTFGDFSTYTIQPFSTIRLMSMPAGWYSL